MRLATTLTAIVLASCQTAPPAPEPAAAPFYNLIDLTDEYTAFYERTQGMETAARVAAFKTEMNTYFPGFYDNARVAEMISSEGYDDLIARSFEEFPEQRAGYEAAARNFVSMIEPARTSFLETFPDAQPVGDIYLIHSVGEMDGGSRTINGQTVIVFGADAMARYQTSPNKRPFFHHELFHFYHDDYFERCDALWCSLWSEGLATYASSVMNPGADDAALGLTVPRPIRAEVDSNRHNAFCMVQARFNSEDPADYASLFFGRQNLEGLPPRAGYYVGMLVAEEAARTHSLVELAHLNAEQARPIVEAALTSLAECSSAPN